MNKIILTLLFLLLSFLITPGTSDTTLATGVDYYISSIYNPKYISNLVSSTGDGTLALLNIPKDTSGSPATGKWKISGGPQLWHLTNGNGYVLDFQYLLGPTASAPKTASPFLDAKADSSRSSQSWLLNLELGGGLPNQARGVWVVIESPTAGKALVVQQGVVTQVGLGSVPTGNAVVDSQVWFFASVTTSIVKSATVTHTETATGPATTLTVNANGPTSTLTSTVWQTQTTTITITSHSSVARRSAAPDPAPEPDAEHPLNKRFDFTTTTVTRTSTHTTTTSIHGPTHTVTSQGGYHYVTDTVTSTTTSTSTSILVVQDSAAAPASSSPAAQGPAGSTSAQTGSAGGSSSQLAGSVVGAGGAVITSTVTTSAEASQAISTATTTPRASVSSSSSSSSPSANASGNAASTSYDAGNLIWGVLAPVLIAVLGCVF